MENPYFTEDMCVSHEAVVRPGESWLAQLLISWALEQRPGGWQGWSSEGVDTDLRP